MEISFGSKGVSNYLNVKIGQLDKKQGYKINMLEENNIAYLLKPISVGIDGELWLKYNTDSTYVLSKFMMRVKPDGELLKIIVLQICECIQNMDKYLLIPEDLVMDPEYILYNYAGREIRLIYVPGYGRGVREQLKQLLEYIMRIFDHRDYDGVSKLYSIYDVVSNESFSLSAIRNLLSGINSSKKEHDIDEQKNLTHSKIDECNTNISGISISRIKDVQSKEIKESKNDKNDKEKITIKVLMMIINVIIMTYLAARYFAFEHRAMYLYIFMGLLIVLIIQTMFIIGGKDDDVDTAMMEYSKINTQQIEEHNEYKCNVNDECDIKNESISKLVPLTNGALESIVLSEVTESLVIGRGRKNTDYRLPTTQISRTHACIYRRSNGIYIEDKNSTNGTFINHVRIQAMNEKKINKGDIIGFANEEFFVS